MLKGRNLVLDTLGEQYALLRPYCTHELWDFASHDPIANSVYVLGRQQITENTIKVINMCNDPRFVMVFDNGAEGSSTVIAQLRVLGLEELVKQNRLLLISGGDMESGYAYMSYEHFLSRILDYQENLSAIQQSSTIFDKKNKPYRFLFLNGRARPHRKYILENFRLAGLLPQVLWTMLDGRRAGSRIFQLVHDGVDLMNTNTPITHLPEKYEVPRYRQNISRLNLEYPHQYAKIDLFQHEWGEIYLDVGPYADTYFSLVTETVIDYPYSFRTEKIAKPLAIGHPWICATNRGFYRDMHNLGFQTFGHLLDESFDLIDNDQQRMDRIIEVVQDLCQQDLHSFLRAAEPVCKYNQQHLAQLSLQVKKEFPQRFFDFVNQHRP